MADIKECETESVKTQWGLLTKNIDDEVKEKWWKIIINNYSEPHRKYHNIVHINNLLENLTVYQHLLQCHEAVGYAIFFHDLVYDPKSADNEENSILLFESFAEETSISQNQPVYETVRELITLTSTHSTDEHKTVGAFGKDDKHFFLDFDMSILGSQPSEYSTYAKQIREEFAFLGTGVYNKLRAKILKSFLQIPNIFATQIFRETFEKQARDNIEQEIVELEP